MYFPIYLITTNSFNKVVTMQRNQRAVLTPRVREDVFRRGLSFAHQSLNDGDPNLPLLEPDLALLFDQADLTVSTKIKNLIKALQQQQDADIGVLASEISEEFPIYFRDARRTPDRGNSYYSFAIMGLHAFFTARKLAELHGLLEDQINIRFSLDSAKMFYTVISDCGPDDHPAAELAIFLDLHIFPEIEALFGIDRVEAEKRLHIAKEFCNFEYKPYAVATLTKHDNPEDSEDPVCVLHIDVPVYELTDTLVSVYENRNQQGWYTRQPLWVQGLIDAYVVSILEGRVIPTQLRKILPGLRNSGHEKLMVIDSKGNKTVIYEGYHSGNLGHLTKGDNKTLTKFSILQLKENIGKSHLHLNALTSPIPLQTERNLHLQVNQTQKAVSTQITYSNTPVNIFRPVAGENLGNLDVIINHFEDLIKQALRHPYYDLWDGSREFWDRLALAVQQNEGVFEDIYAQNRCFQALLNTVLEYRTLRHSDDDDQLSDGNRNFELAVKIKLMAFYYNQCVDVLGLNKRNYSLAVNDFCMSGKDREGLLRLATVSAAISNYLHISEDTVLPVIAAAQHIQRQAGMFGATLGAYGFLPQLTYTLPDRFKRIEYLLLHSSAPYNKKFPKMANVTLTLEQERHWRERLALVLRENNDHPEALIGNEDLLADAYRALFSKVYEDFLDGKFENQDIPAVIELLHCAKKLRDHRDPASADYWHKLRRCSQLIEQMPGKQSPGHLVAGIALAFLAVAIVVASIALAAVTGGISLLGIAISANLIGIIGLSTGGVIGLGSLTTTLFGVERGIAKAGRHFLIEADKQGSQSHQAG